MKFIEDIKLRMFSGADRSIKAKKNILWMLLLKGGNILIGLILVPLTLNYVDLGTYGIWLTLSSMIAWISFFDIGLNNGLKNRLTEAFAAKDIALGKKYVSTTYAIMTMIFVPLMVLLLIAAPFIDWNSLLKLQDALSDDLFTSIAIIVTYFCINFILSTINVIMLADQHPSLSSLQQFIQQATSLVIIYILTVTTKGNLTNLCIGLCASPIIVVVLFNFILFSGKYKSIAPSVKCIDFSVAPSLLKLGIQFFIIQIAGVIQYQMINFLIIRYYGASEVASYNIAFKYFSILTMVWGILTTPLWAATTDAMARNDYQWIKNTEKMYLKAFVAFSAGGIMMLFLSPIVYDLWVGNKASITFVLSIFVLLYNLTTMFCNIFVLIINGSGQLKIQTYACCISPFVFLLTFYFCSQVFQIGIVSVLVAAIVSNFNGLILAPIQCYYIYKNRN